MSCEHTQSGWPGRIAFGLTALGVLVTASTRRLDRPCEGTRR
jgi:hypothetical protein